MAEIAATLEIQMWIWGRGSSLVAEIVASFGDTNVDIGEGTFLGGLGVRTQHFHHYGRCSVPGLGTEIPHQTTACCG